AAAGARHLALEPAFLAAPRPALSAVESLLRLRPLRCRPRPCGPRSRPGRPGGTAGRPRCSVLPAGRAVAEGFTEFDGRRNRSGGQRAAVPRHLQAFSHHGLERPVVEPAAAERGVALVGPRPGAARALAADAAAARRLAPPPPWPGARRLPPYGESSRGDGLARSSD